MLRTALVAACLAATASVSRAGTCPSVGITSSNDCVTSCSSNGYPVSSWHSSESNGVTTQSCTCDPSTSNVQMCSGSTGEPATEPASSASSTTMAAAAAVGAFVAYVL